MNHRKIRFSDLIADIGAKILIAALVAIVTITALLIAGCRYVYQNVKENTSLQCERNAKISAQEFNRYLIVGNHTTALVGYTIDNMLAEGRTTVEILNYMTDETKSIQSFVDNGFTGIYGWVNDRYLDGDGWVPNDDYVPTERPWYIETMENKGEGLSYIKPYVDAQTNTVMMTIAKKLRDGESVIALDISLSGIKDITDKIASSAKGAQGIVFDNSGSIVAHSDYNKTDYKFMEDDCELGKLIYNKILSGGSGRFEIVYDNDTYLIYAEELECGWYCVSAINTHDLFRGLRIFAFVAFFAILIIITIITLIFLDISKSNLITKEQNAQLASVSQIYISMYDVNLEKDTYQEICCNAERISEVVGPTGDHAQETLYNAMNLLTDKSCLDEVHEFINMSTLDDRMKNQDTITEEHLNNVGKWCRGRFIAGERGADDKLKRVLWVVEPIDTEKRQRDKLLLLSETDRMTDIFNRSAGENKIRKLMREGVGGMLMLLDVDKFKSINDNFGHDIGDKVIVAIAESMKKTFRSRDIVFRLGGDEFAAYAVGVTSQEEGRPIIERFFEKIKNIKIDALGDTKVLVSVGVAFYYNSEMITFEELYKRADECTYKSKKHEGNYVSFYEIKRKES
ncbi:MAG TPA: hypothetical protein DCP07_00780 [Lachnospiraceae bacterium]|nr:hypothetical protein [Lachnospiraceae bacterium]